jgi:hypothetical protein
MAYPQKVLNKIILLNDQSNDVVSLIQSYFDKSKLDATTIPCVNPTKSQGLLRSNSDDDNFDLYM